MSAVAHLWIRDESSQWGVLRLESTRLNFSGTTLLRAPDGEWLVIASPQGKVRVNGTPVASGMRALSDRDEIRVGEAAPAFFSTEHLASVESFPGAEKAFLCQRCKQEIPKEAKAVQCPNCRVWHHQSEELPCWTYAETCAVCDHGTSLDATYRWTPEQL